ncbi:MAG TPA: GNAT family N-acetyltransferase [Candidatus Dormibacteraeota bacterium]
METIELVPFTQEQFDAWLPRAIAGYAHEHVSTGRWSEAESIEKSREEHARLLPQGPATPGHHMWSIVRAGDHQPVGLLWIQVMDKPTPRAFIYNIEIDPEFRRRGYAMQAMKRLEEEARSLGLDSIGLHVFGHNTAARPLYEKLGYIATNINMTKPLT